MPRGRRTISKPKALAFFGSGASSANNTEDLLDDFLGFSNGVPDDDDTYLLLPAFSDLPDGLATVYDWVNKHELAFDVAVDPWSDGIKELTEYADQEHSLADLLSTLQSKAETHDTFLVFLWGDEGDKDSEKLLDEATKAGVKCLDLTAGLDTIAFEDDEPEDQAATEKKVEDTPPWNVDEEPERKPEPLAADPEPLEPENSGGEETKDKDTWTPEEIGQKFTPADTDKLWTGVTEVILSLHQNLASLHGILGSESHEAINGYSRLEEAIYWFQRAESSVTSSQVRDLDDTAKFLGGDATVDTPGTVTVSVSEPEETPQNAETPASEEPPKRRRGRPRKTAPTE